MEGIKFTCIYKFDGKSIIIKKVPVFKRKGLNEIDVDTTDDEVVYKQKTE